MVTKNFLSNASSISGQYQLMQRSAIIEKSSPNIIDVSICCLDSFGLTEHVLETEYSTLLVVLGPHCLTKNSCVHSPQCLTALNGPSV